MVLWSRVPAQRRRFAVAWASIVAACGLAAGCGERGQVEHYRVPKPHLVAQKNPGRSPASEHAPGSIPTRDRMLAAILPHGSLVWFFKLSGPADDVAAHADEFVSLIQSVRFDNGADEQPKWTLPQGWSELPGGEMRYATLNIPTDGEPLGLAVSTLPRPEEGYDDFVLRNVNRWREQLQLPAIALAQLSESTMTLASQAGEATVVNLSGALARGGSPAAPFAGMGAGGRGAKPAATARAAQLAYAAPEGWIEDPPQGMRKAAFHVEDGGQRVEITVIQAGGDVLDNVNRWREQIQLAPVSQAELEGQLRSLQVDGAAASMVELVGPAEASPRETILGVIVPQPGTSWFIKLKGDAELAEREKSRFEAFVQSLRLQSSRS